MSTVSVKIPSGSTCFYECECGCIVFPRQFYLMSAKIGLNQLTGKTTYIPSRDGFGISYFFAKCASCMAFKAVMLPRQVKKTIKSALEMEFF